MDIHSLTIYSVEYLLIHLRTFSLPNENEQVNRDRNSRNRYDRGQCRDAALVILTLLLVAEFIRLFTSSRNACVIIGESEPGI